MKISLDRSERDTGARGINVRLNAKCLAVRKQGKELAVTLDCTKRQSRG